MQLSMAIWPVFIMSKGKFLSLPQYHLALTLTVLLNKITRHEIHLQTK